MSAENYIEYLYLRQVMSKAFDDAIGDAWQPEEVVVQHFREALPAALERRGYRPEKPYEELVRKHLNAIIQRNGVVFEGDAYTGRFARVIPANKLAYAKQALSSNPVTARLSRLGQTALNRAIEVIAAEEEWHSIEEATEVEEAVSPGEDLSDGHIEIPASDRIVTLGHNQAPPLVSATEELIQTIESTTNSIDGDVGLRVRILGQLRAAKELLVVGVFKLQALQVTLIEALQFLAKRYENEAIGALATALLTELLKAISG